MSVTNSEWPESPQSQSPVLDLDFAIPQRDGVHACTREDNPPPADTESPSPRERFMSYFVGDTPSWWSESPTSFAGMARYARQGAWCREDSPWRWAGIAYCYAVAFPGRGLAICLDWATQRPLRLLGVAIVIAVIVAAI